MERKVIQQRQAFGEALLKVGKTRDDIVVLDADVGTTTKVSLFGDEFPDRFFQAGIAEANMVSMAAGFATTGKVAVTAAFSYFLSSRVVDQIRSICYANLNVKFVGTHGGVSPTVDGASHHALTDLAHMRCLPNMTVLCPGDPKETEEAVEEMLKINGPVYLRLSRNECTQVMDKGKFQFGKARVITEGRDVTLVSTGVMIERTLLAAEKLRDEGLRVGVIHAGTIKPFDANTLRNAAQSTKAILTIEEHNIIGGLGSAVAESIASGANCKFDRIGIQDTYTRSGGYEELLDLYGLSVDNIVKKATDIVK